MNFGCASSSGPSFPISLSVIAAYCPGSAPLLPDRNFLTFLFTLAPIFPVHNFRWKPTQIILYWERCSFRVPSIELYRGKSVRIFSLWSILLYHNFFPCQECFEKNFNISENYHTYMVNFHNFGRYLKIRRINAGYQSEYQRQLWLRGGHFHRGS